MFLPLRRGEWRQFPDHRGTTRNSGTNLRKEIMNDFLPFPSRDYFLMLALLLVSRGTDALSTWVATPNLVLEGNPIAKKLGWKWGSLLNLVLCGACGAWPLAA